MDAKIYGRAVGTCTHSLLVFALILAGSGCDAVDQEDSEEDLLARMAALVESSFKVLDVLTGQVLFPGESGIPARYSCQNGGLVEIERKGTARYTFNFVACESLRGAIDLDLSLSHQDGSFELKARLNGLLEGSCKLQFGNLVMEDVLDVNNEYRGIPFNGAVGGLCDEDSFSCRFDGNLLSDNKDGTLFREKCSASRY